MPIKDKTKYPANWKEISVYTPPADNAAFFYSFYALLRMRMFAKKTHLFLFGALCYSEICPLHIGIIDKYIILPCIIREQNKIIFWHTKKVVFAVN